MACAILASALVQPLAGAQQGELPAGPHRNLVYGKCQTCHSLQYVEDSAGITRNQWASVLSDMGMYGLDVSDDERAKILGYLATYLGPKPPPEKGPAGSEAQAEISGQQLFQQQCSACHQADGSGRAGVFPPLAGNPDVFLTEEYPVLVLLNGLQGKIEVEGVEYQGQMPSFAHLSDAKIASVVNYIRGAWENGESHPDGTDTMSAEDVGAARARSIGAEQLQAYRAEHKAR